MRELKEIDFVRIDTEKSKVECSSKHTSYFSELIYFNKTTYNHHLIYSKIFCYVFIEMRIMRLIGGKLYPITRWSFLLYQSVNCEIAN